MSIYAIGQKVQLLQTGEPGIVVGRQEHMDVPTSYLVRYTPAESEGEHDRWIEEHQIEAAPEA